MLETFCALCGIKSSFKLLNIVSSLCDEAQVHDLIIKYLHIEIKSKFLCTECLEQIQKFHRYYEKVHQSQKVILSLKATKTNDPTLNIIKDIKACNKDKKRCINDFEGKKIEILENDIDHLTYAEQWGCFDDNLKKPICTDESVRKYGERAHKKRKECGDDSGHMFESNVGHKISFMTKEDLKNVNYDADKEVDYKISSFMDLICIMCNEKFSTFNRIMRHYHNNHQIRGFINCCGLKFYTRIELIDHIDANHLNSDRLKCRICEKRLATTRSLRRHMINIHRWKKEELYPCDICINTSFSKPVDLKRHKFEIHSTSSYVCFKCKRTFKNEVNLLFHEENIHNRKPPPCLICDLCGKIFKTAGGFYKHTKEVHEGRVKGRQECNICGSLVKNLEYHKKMAHPPEGTIIKCKECNKEMKTWFALKSHRANIHLVDKRKFLCNICDKGFKNRKLLREHNAAHTGQPLYTCPYCPTTFKHESNYLKHKKRQHINEWLEEKRVKYINLKSKE